MPCVSLENVTSQRLKNVVFNTFESIGFTDEELSDLGYEYLIFSDE